MERDYGLQKVKENKMPEVKTSPFELDTLADKIVAEVKGAKEQFKDRKISNFKDVLSLVPFLVRLLENLSYKSEINKADKKVLAVKVLNRLIDVPALPEWAEEKLLGLLVDQVVEAFNQTLGKVWKTNKEEKS